MFKSNVILAATLAAAAGFLAAAFIAGPLFSVALESLETSESTVFPLSLRVSMLRSVDIAAQC